MNRLIFTFHFKRIESKVIEMKSLEFMCCVLPLILKMLVILNNNI
jgi:hypothetical protein